MTTFSKNAQTLVQSDYLYLQSAGSPGNTDGSSAGIHLRWSLRGTLGDQHLPKGNLAESSGPYPTTIGFNKNNDFIRIYRRSKNLNPVSFSLNTLSNDKINDAGNSKEWIFSSGDTVVSYKFTDPNEYEVLKTKHDLTATPGTNGLALINEYQGVIEIRVNKPFLGAKLYFGEGGNDTTLRLEGISKGREENLSTPVISHRKAIPITSGSTPTLEYEFFEEDLQYLRFSGITGSNLGIDIYTYDAEIFGPNWSLTGSFSLTEETTTAKDWLQDTARFNLTNWPKYNDGSTVVLSNYHDRWSDNDGVQDAVQEYLRLSQTDVFANKIYSQSNPANSNGDDDQAELELSILDALKIMSIDYHIARMLGLGYIDTPGSGDFLYMAEYVTEDALDTGIPAATRSHFYMGLPVSMQEERPTITPVQSDLSFGLWYDQGQGQRTYITDNQGYALTEDKRYIRVNIDGLVFPPPLEPFFATTNTIEASKHTKPVAYGVEYKNTGAGAWIEPELNHDTSGDFLDNNGNPETEPIFYTGKNPLFIYDENNQGSHTYAVYGINWFSRASGISNTRQETTTFPNRLKLLPPFDIKPHLIQHENPLIFTTSADQTRYDDNLNVDKTIVRTQLVIDHRHNIAHKDSDKIQFFFRENPVNVVEGQVKSITDTSPYSCRVRTKSYVKASINTVVSPVIPNGEESHYVGSFLVVENEQYEIINVQQSSVSGEGPIFEINKIKDNSIVTTGSQQQAISSKYKSPKADKKFTTSEDLTNPARWTQLSKEITIVKFSNHQESQILADGTEKILDIGGIYELASIQADPVNPGFYDIVFNSFNLTQHPDPNVEWRGGLARIGLASDQSEKKELEIVQMDLTGSSTLEIKVYDNNYSGEPIATGANINVNLFPGYQIYLYAETGFGEAETLPATGDMTRLTYISTRSRDSSLNINSYLSTAKPIIAKEVIIPVRTERPIGNSYATRPNYYGKSSYTFDTIVDTTGGRQPFALVFYRANTEGLLRALYKESTYQTLKTQLDSLKGDPEYNQFWVDLINMELVSNQFKTYTNSGFQFPNPDRVYDVGASEFDVTKDPGSTPDYQDLVRDKMMNAFVPLTEQPVLFMYIKTGKVTSPKPPKIRDEFGNLIPPGSPEFDQAPMATKFIDGADSKVRFTDYNLDGASQDLYFYAARELSNEYTFSAFSEVDQPIRILNTMPFTAPSIKNIESVVADPVNNVQVGVKFEIGEYADALNITHAKIYRAKTANDAKSVRTMDVQGPIDLANEVLKDEFDDLNGDIPYGEPLFYRIVACKTIINESGAPELIDSLPSDILLSNVVDNSAPLAPEITATYTGPSGNPATITSVTLEWDKAVHSGKYILYKMNTSGNWNKIHEITGDNSSHFTLDLINSDLANSNLVIEDSEGNEIYHHFKLEVINASGLSSRNEEILTLGEELSDTGFSGFPTIIDQMNIVVDTGAETVTKTGAYGWNNAGGFSVQSIPGDGYVERVIGGALNDNVRVCVGLSYANGGPDKASINYSIESGPNQDVRLEVNGGYSGISNDYQLGDKLKVERDGTEIKFYHISGGIETLVKTVSETSANPSNVGNPLFVDFSIANTGSVIFGLKLVTEEAVTPPPPPPPSNFSGFPDIVDQANIIVDIVAETITKNGSYGWNNAGGFSQQFITGDGYVERVVDGTITDNVRVCMGLSYSNGGPDKASIDYSIETGPNESVRLEVNGGYAGVSSNYQLGDKFKIERVGTDIKFYHISGGIETLVKTVSETTANPSNVGDPLYVDFSIANNGSILYGLNLVDL